MSKEWQRHWQMIYQERRRPASTWDVDLVAGKP